MFSKVLDPSNLLVFDELHENEQQTDKIENDDDDDDVDDSLINSSTIQQIESSSKSTSIVDDDDPDLPIFDNSNIDIDNSGDSNEKTNDDRFDNRMHGVSLTSLPSIIVNNNNNNGNSNNGDDDDDESDLVPFDLTEPSKYVYVY